MNIKKGIKIEKIKNMDSAYAWYFSSRKLCTQNHMYKLLWDYSVVKIQLVF